MTFTPLAAVLVLASVAILPGCATESSGEKPGGSPTNAPSPAVIEARPGDEVRLQRGQLLAISLDSNASTGYAWEMIDRGNPVLEPAPVPPSDAPTPTPMPGAGEISRWRFRASQPGIATVRMVYRRSWEEGIEPVRTATYRIIVD